MCDFNLDVYYNFIKKLFCTGVYVCTKTFLHRLNLFIIWFYLNFNCLFTYFYFTITVSSNFYPQLVSFYFFKRLFIVHLYLSFSPLCLSPPLSPHQLLMTTLYWIQHFVDTNVSKHIGPEIVWEVSTRTSIFLPQKVTIIP